MAYSEYGDVSADWETLRAQHEETERTGLHVSPQIKNEASILLIQRYWDRYWKSFRGGEDPRERMLKPQFECLYNFFHWLLTIRKKHIKGEATLQLYWGSWNQLRAKYTWSRLDPTIRDRMRAARGVLAAEFHLRRHLRPKPILRIEDELELHKALFLSPHVNFPHERHRVELLLLSQIAGITGNRPAALLALRYEHIRVSTILVDGISRPIVDWEFAVTKSYRGSKSPNEFPIPHIPFEPCLLLCPETSFLALAFADEAFAVTDFRSAEQYYRLQVTPGTGQLPLLWKQSKLKQYIFRRCLQGTISDEEGWSTHQLNKRFQMAGSAAGFKLPTVAYTYRRGAAEGLDNSSLISEQQRNAILEHENSDVFRRNYISHHITQDVHAVRRGLQPQTSLIRAATSMSRTIDARRPRKLSSRQIAEVDNRADLRLLLRRMKGLKNQAQRLYGKSLRQLRHTLIHHQYTLVRRDHRNFRRRILQDSLKQVIAEFELEQPNIDLQRQLDGLPPLVAAPIAPNVDIHPLISRAFHALYSITTKGAEEEIQRRNQAVTALAALCHLRQGPRQFCRNDADPPSAYSFPDRSHGKTSVAIICKETQCIFCIGDVGLDESNRFRSFHRKGDLWKHWQRLHLPREFPSTCPHPGCDEIMRHLEHLRNHADRVHNTPT